MPNKLCFKDNLSLMFSGKKAIARAKPCLKYGTNSENFIKCFIGSLDIYSPDPFTMISQLNSTPVCIIYDNNNNLYITVDVPNSGIFIIKSNSSTPVLWESSQPTILNLPVSMSFNPSFTEMYVVDFGNNKIFIINVATGIITKELTNTNLVFNPLIFTSGPLQACNGGTLNSSSTYLYVTNTDPNWNNVIRINLDTLETTLVANIAYPILICNNKINNSFFVSSLTTNSVYIITNEGISYPYITGGEISEPRGVIVDNNCSTLFVTNYNKNGTNNSEINYISVYNISNINSPTFLFNITGSVLSQPRGLCFIYNNDNNLIISNFQSKTIYSCNLTQYVTNLY